ncbi:MAG TPA: NAD(P)/FAD-dependent oxidoreductase [Thermoleophilaceae bacterium]
MKVAIVGAGFSGIGTAIALRRAGIDDVTLFERGDGPGGVWRENTYPGAACDVPSYLYSYSFEQRRDWTQPCSGQAEILGYLRDTVRRHDLEPRIRTNTEIAHARFDEVGARWELEAASGERFEADALVVACGQLSRPSSPQLPGRDEFPGASFHSAEWNHDVDLNGKRVAVIGTGASAIQFVPRIAEQAARVDVYQRTPPWLLPRRNPTYPRWARALIRHVPGAQSLRRGGLRTFMELGILGQTLFPPARWLLRAWSATFMRGQVADPELRHRIWPEYPFGCKRILFSSDWLPALQRPNVELITERVERIGTEGPVTTDGVEREVDCIVYGTGFKADEFVLPLEIEGRGGRELQRAWDGGARAHLGIAVAGFPNMFLLYGPNTNLGFGSIVVMIEAQARYVVDALRRARAHGGALEVRPEVQAASDERVQARLRHSVWTGCRSWYRVDGDGRIVNNWPGFMAEYAHATRALKPDEYRWVEPAAGAAGR